MCSKTAPFRESKKFFMRRAICALQFTLPSVVHGKRSCLRFLCFYECWLFVVGFRVGCFRAWCGACPAPTVGKACKMKTKQLF